MNRSEVNEFRIVSGDQRTESILLNTTIILSNLYLYSVQCALGGRNYLNMSAIIVFNYSIELNKRCLTRI